MKIAMVAPLAEACPPKYYGGTERIVASLCDNLVELGHDVTLFASGDSKTNAKLHPITSEGLRLLNPPVKVPQAYTMQQIDIVLQQAHKFDIVHNHVDFMPFAFLRTSPCPWVTTLHGRLDLKEFITVYEHFKRLPLISISDAQRRAIPNNNWVKTIYHGINVQSFIPKYSPGDYLAFIGRIHPEKGIDRAITIAKASGIPLKIAAKVAEDDPEYYERIKHLIDGKHIEFIGEIAEHEKSEFLNNALAMLFPIDWPEPFGLAVIEAYACGTPVITRPVGSMPEIVDDGISGFIRTETDELIKAVQDVHTLDRRMVRQYAEQRFTAKRMAQDYITIFEKITKEYSPIVNLETAA